MRSKPANTKTTWRQRQGYNKDCVIQIRLTATEKADMEAMANKLDYPRTVAEYLRRLHRQYGKALIGSIPSLKPGKRKGAK